MKNGNKRLIQSARKVYKLWQKTTRRDRAEGQVIVMPYRGFTNGQHFFLKGRVLEDQNIQVQANDSKFTNLINTFKRFESDELPNAEIAVHINEQTFSIISDEEGYFSLYEKLENPLPVNDQFWKKALVELLQLPGRKFKTTTTASFFYPTTKAKFGVISDIDDTVLRTHVTSTLGLKMLYATLLSNAHQRRPMEGIVELLQALARGPKGNAHNPFFYVSNSPWNLYDLLIQFMEVQQLPRGPILLRDYGLSPANFSAAFQEHKQTSMGTILKTYPDLPFILLGDTGSKDVDHYLAIAQEYPGQIKTIYIRKLGDTNNVERVTQLITSATNVDILLVRNTEEIWQDVRKKGYVG